MCIRLYQGTFHQNGRMSTDPFSAPLLFWSCFIKKFFVFFMLLLHFALPFFSRWKCSDRDECERDIWGKRSLRHHNAHAGNSEHIYHFSWRFVQFSSVQLGASVPKDVASCIQERSQNPSLHFRGDCDSQNPTVHFFHIVLLKVAMKIHTHSHAQIKALLKVVHQCDTTQSHGVNTVSLECNYFSCKINLQSLGKSTLY